MTARPGCPFCGEPDGELDEISPGRFAAICNDCGAIGPSAATQEHAAMLWDARVNRMDWPVRWLQMPDDPRTAGIEVTIGKRGE